MFKGRIIATFVIPKTDDNGQIQSKGGDQDAKGRWLGGDVYERCPPAVQASFQEGEGYGEREAERNAEPVLIE